MVRVVLILSLVVALVRGEGGTWGDDEEDGGVQHSCPPCQSVECEVLHQCVAGVVPDRCGCCQECARTEGELCDHRGDQKFGTCGDNLDCQFQHETGESVCVCRYRNDEREGQITA